MREQAFQVVLPLSNTLKYSLLVLAIALFLIALFILVWKLHQYYIYKTAVKVKETKYQSDGYNEKKPGGTILVKSLAPTFLDLARKEQDSKIQLMQKEMERLEEHLTPSPPSTESLDDMISESDPLYGSRGKLKFSLLYDKKKMIYIKVFEAVELPMHSRDPFVKIKVLCKADEPKSELLSILHEWETKVGRNNRDPVFDDEFSCSLKEYHLPNISLKFEVKNFDKYSRHTLIGETRMTLKDLKGLETLTFCKELQGKTKDAIGEVLISLKCLPTSQKIEVGVLKFKTASQIIIQDSDVYARIDVFSNQHKQKHQKSSLRAKSKVTVFNETFLFSLPDATKTHCLILISLYETLASGRKLIGQTSLGNQKAKSDYGHWELMMESLRQPVAVWHPLFI